MLLDNIGLLVAGLFRQPSSGSLNINVKSITGATINTGVYQTHTNTTMFNSIALRQAQIGQGSTPPARTDFNIETPFSNAPESVRNTSLDFGYNSPLGKITIGTTISPAGGPGTITEVTKYVSWRSGGAVNNVICIIRDIVSPGVNFVLGQSIQIDHEVII